MTHIPQSTMRRAEQAAWDAYDQARRLGDPDLEQFAAAYCALAKVAAFRAKTATPARYATSA